LPRAWGQWPSAKKIKKNTPASAFPSPLSAPSRRFSSLLRTVPTPPSAAAAPAPGEVTAAKHRVRLCSPRAGTSSWAAGPRRRGDADLGFRSFLAGGCGSEAPRSDLPVCDPPLVLLRLMTPPLDPLSLHLPLCIAQAMTAAADCAADSTTANPARVPWRGGTHGCSPGAGAPLARRPGQAPAAAIPARRPLHGRPPGAATWAGLAGCATSNFYLLFTYVFFLPSTPTGQDTSGFAFLLCSVDAAQSVYDRFFIN